MDSKPVFVDNRQFANLCLAALILCSIALGAATLIFKYADSERSVFTAPNFVGPTAQSLIAGRGLEVCSEAMGTEGNPICFHSARMPVGTLVLAAATELFGDDVKRVAIFKGLLCLIPLWAALAVVLRQRGQNKTYLVACSLLLLTPLLMPLYFTSVLNLAVEEGYMLGFIALAVALLVFPLPSSIFAWGVLASLTLAAIYLTKSSMLAAVLVLLAGFFVRAPDWRIRVLIVGLFALAPVSWAAIQHDASGRYTLGTSLDGINLHKGNNAAFLDRYPPHDDTNLDQYDNDLNRGHFFKDEWTFNDFHMKAGLDFARENIGATLQGVLKKTDVMFFSLNHYGGAGYGAVFETIIFLNMIAFRLLLWGGIAISAFAAATDKSIGRIAGVSFLLFVAAYALPYIAGFAYTRHVMVLAMPAMIVICRALLNETPARIPLLRGDRRFN